MECKRRREGTTHNLVFDVYKGASHPAQSIALLLSIPERLTNTFITHDKHRCRWSGHKGESPASQFPSVSGLGTNKHLSAPTFSP